MATNFRTRSAARRGSRFLILCSVLTLPGTTTAEGQGTSCLVGASICPNHPEAATTWSDTYQGANSVSVRDLPTTDETGAMSCADRLRANVLAIEIPHDRPGAPLTATVSIGVATAMPREGSSSTSSFVMRSFLWNCHS